MGLVTVFCPLTIRGAGRLVVHTGEARLVVDCNVKPVKLVGHVRITLAPEGMMVSCGGLTDPNEMLNTVPKPLTPPAPKIHPYIPPFAAVPYRTSSDKIKPPLGLAPSLLV